MKKALIILLALAAILLGGFFYISKTYLSGDAYYVKITTDGTRIEDTYDDGSPLIDYKYELTGYDESGQTKKLVFNGNKDRPLRKNAFLKVTYSEKKHGVTQWEEVGEKDIPEKALAHLN